MHRTARFILAVLDRLSVALAFVAGVAVFLLAFLIVVDVVARRLFQFSLQGTDELGGYVLAMVGSLGLAYVLSRRGFTRIDVLFRFFPFRLAAILHVLAYCSLAGLAIFFASQAIREFEETLLFDAHANTPLQTPLWIPQGMWVAGMSFFAVTAIIHALRSIAFLLADPGRLETEYGFSTVEQEVEEFQRQRESTR